MDTRGHDAPTLVAHGRATPRRLRAAVDAGRRAVVVSNRDRDLRVLLDGLVQKLPPAVALRLGGGRTVTLVADADGQWPTYAYWPKTEPEQVWRWACRACGAVADRWSWRDVDEATPMVRHLIVLDEPEPVEVPWDCPRGTCHGAPRWQLCS